MPTATLGSLAQQLPFRPPEPPPPPPSRGLLSGSDPFAQGEFPTPLLEWQGGGSCEALVTLDTFLSDLSPVSERTEVPAESVIEGLAGELQRRPPSMLTGRRTVLHTRPEAPGREADVKPFVLAVRDLLENERLTAARQVLDAAPAYIRSDPLVTRLRSVLAPPVVKRAQRREVDRSREYDWLRAHGREHRGRWVALVGGTLLASAPTLRELRAELRAMAPPHPPLLHRVD